MITYNSSASATIAFPYDDYTLRTEWDWILWTMVLWLSGLEPDDD